jgi:hypothetical protein
MNLSTLHKPPEDLAGVHVEAVGGGHPELNGGDWEERLVSWTIWEEFRTKIASESSEFYHSLSLVIIGVLAILSNPGNLSPL